MIIKLYRPPINYNNIKPQRFKVLMDDPHPCSQANLVMLEHSLQKQDTHKKEVIQHKYFYKKTMAFKKQLFGKLLREDSTCHYCKKELNKQSATLEHVIPLWTGISYYDKSNIVLACHTCNHVTYNPDPYQKTKKELPITIHF